MQINDPDGQALKVNSEGRALTYTVTEHESLHANEDGNAYSVVFEADPNGTDIDFFYLKNTHATDDLVIHKIRMSTTAVDIDVDIKLGVTGTPTTGTAVVPANLKAGSGGVALVTAEWRDADMALTGGTVVDTLYIDKDFVGVQEFNYEGGLILPPNQALVFNNVGSDPTADINCVVFFYYHV